MSPCKGDNNSKAAFSLFVCSFMVKVNWKPLITAGHADFQDFNRSGLWLTATITIQPGILSSCFCSQKSKPLNPILCHPPGDVREKSVEDGF